MTSEAWLSISSFLLHILTNPFFLHLSSFVHMNLFGCHCKEICMYAPGENRTHNSQLVFMCPFWKLRVQTRSSLEATHMIFSYDFLWPPKLRLLSCPLWESNSRRSGLRLDTFSPRYKFTREVPSTHYST